MTINNKQTNKSFKKKVLSKKEIEQALIDNFINLQKVLTNLSTKFEELSNNISKLLQLFEISAKSFAKKYSENGEKTGDVELAKKIDILLDQNKTISKGLMLIEEKIRNKDIPRVMTRNPPERFKSNLLPRY